MGAHIRAMCMNLHGPLESPTRESCEGWSYNPSGRRWDVSITCWGTSHPPSSHYWDEAPSQSHPMIWSIYLGLVERMLVSWSWMWCPKLMLCSITANLCECSSPICWWCSFNLKSIQQPVCTKQTWLLYTPQCPQFLVILDQPKGSTVFISRSPNNLMCQDSTLLM